MKQKIKKISRRQRIRPVDFVFGLILLISLVFFTGFLEAKNKTNTSGKKAKETGNSIQVTGQIQNPGFEEGFQPIPAGNIGIGWQAYTPPAQFLEYRDETSNMHSSAHAQGITIRRGETIQYQYVSGLTAGQPYNLSMWFFATAAENYFLGYEPGHVSPQAITHWQQIPVVSNQWVQAQMTTAALALPDATIALRVMVPSVEDVNTINDDWSLQPLNQPPQLNISFEPLNPTTEDFLTFKSGASDPDGEVVDWNWNFGDGSDVLQDDPMYHRFNQAGTYNVSLTVTDDKGATTTSNVNVTVSNIRPTLNLPYGWSMMSLPYPPVNPDPPAVFKDPQGNPIPISGNLHRYDHAGQRYVTYYDFNPSELGPMRAGDGYWFSCLNPSGCQVQYEAFVQLTDPLEIVLSTVGWYMISASSVNNDFKNLKVTNNSTGETKSFQEASNLWLQDPFIGYDNAGSRYFTAGLLGTDNEHTLRQNNGFWIYAFVDNLTLKIPNKRPYPKIKIPSEGQALSGNITAIVTDLYDLTPEEINSVEFQVYKDGAWQPIKGIWETGEPRNIDLLDWDNVWETQDIPTGTYPFRIYVNSVYGEYTDEISVYIHKEPVPMMTTALSEDHTAVVFDGTSSYDPEDGPSISHEWNFTDDPATYYTSIVSHPVSTSGPPDSTYEFGVEHKTIDSLGGFKSEHWISRVLYGPGGGLPETVEIGEKSCGCNKMVVKNTGNSHAIQDWMPSGKKMQLGAYDNIDMRKPDKTSFQIRHNFQVEAALNPMSEPDKCREGQRVKRTSTQGGKTYPKKNAPERKDDWSLGVRLIEAPFGGDKWADDDYRLPAKYKFHIREEKILWMDSAGNAKVLKFQLPFTYKANYEARVWGPTGACKCTWDIEINTADGKNELKNVVCTP